MFPEFGSYQTEAEFAYTAVEKAARMGMRVQDEMTGARVAKQDRSPVTVADFTCQALVAAALSRAYPEDTLVAEEDSATLHRPDAAELRAAVTRYVASQESEATPAQIDAWIDRGAGLPARRFWVLDPVDGTAGFLRGQNWVVALALIEDGQLQVGALACPHLSLPGQPKGETPLGYVLVAGRGRGTWAAPLGGQGFSRVHVSERKDSRQARLMGSVEPGHTDERALSALRHSLGVTVPMVKLDSQAKAASVAAGVGDLIVRLLPAGHPEYQEKIWDQAAGALIVEEAGGRVTDLRGAPLDFTAGRTLKRNYGVLVSNGHLHDAALEAVHQIGADGRNTE